MIWNFESQLNSYFITFHLATGENDEQNKKSARSQFTVDLARLKLFFLNGNAFYLYHRHADLTPSIFKISVVTFTIWRHIFLPKSLFHLVKGAGSFHIHRKTMKELGTLAVLDVLRHKRT